MLGAIEKLWLFNNFDGDSKRRNLPTRFSPSSLSSERDNRRRLLFSSLAGENKVRRGILGPDGAGSFGMTDEITDSIGLVNKARFEETREVDSVLVAA